MLDQIGRNKEKEQSNFINLISIYTVLGKIFGCYAKWLNKMKLFPKWIYILVNDNDLLQVNEITQKINLYMSVHWIVFLRFVLLWFKSLKPVSHIYIWHVCASFLGDIMCWQVSLLNVSVHQNQTNLILLIKKVKK